MGKEGFTEAECGLDLKESDLKDKKLVLIRCPLDADISKLYSKKIAVPPAGALSNPILPNNEVSGGVNYKMMVDKDHIEDTFRPILKGGTVGPSFDASISIVKCVVDNESDKAESTPAINAYSKVPQFQGLKPCLLPFGSSISQTEFESRIARLGSKSENINNITPSIEKKKKRKSKSIEDSAISKSDTKRKKEKKTKK